MSFLDQIAASTLLPIETISVALTSAPQAIPVLSNIYKLSTEIRETTERVQGNKEQCKQLSERIDTLIGFLAERDFSKNLNEALEIALRRFETFLRRCLEFIETFLETSWFKRVINNKDFERKFLDLNRELTQYSNDINFGIGLSNLPVNKNQDENRRVNIIADESKQVEKDFKQQKVPEIVDNDNNYISIPYQTLVPVTNNSPNMNASRFPVNPQQGMGNIFTSGLWKYQYKQYNQYFGPFPQQITFNPRMRILSGYGEDNVGQYVLNGTFSEATGQIEMTQTYQIGTGNPNLNYGHQDIIKIIYNPGRRVFEGIAYSQVNGTLVPGAFIEMWPA